MLAAGGRATPATLPGSTRTDVGPLAGGEGRARWVLPPRAEVFRPADQTLPASTRRSAMMFASNCKIAVRNAP